VNLERRVRLRYVAVILLLVVGALFIEQATRMTPHVRDQVVSSLNTRFASQVELDALQVGVFPKPTVAGEGVALRYNGRTDVPPLISVRAFSASAGLAGLWRKPIRLKTLHLDGLEIRIPAGGLNPKGMSGGTPNAGHGTTKVIGLDTLLAHQALLEIASADPTKLPRRFEIHNLEMTDFGEGTGATFTAQLTNPKPLGDIQTQGTFGPWQAGNPRLTPIKGDYRFSRADLNTIKGIGGILSSVGNYQGVLERIAVRGRTETPDFSIDVGGQPMPLTTEFEAIVDGTNGNTFLERVEARLRNTTIVARGAVVRSRDVKGREIGLDVSIDRGHIEDLLALAIKATKAPMTGGVTLKTRLVIPAGQASVVDKLRLAGEFDIAHARFSNLDVQKRINFLSRKGKGDEAAQLEDEGPGAVSRLRGRFVMRDASIQFSQLSFAVDGATVQLVGGYNLRTEALDFSGELLLDASLADMTTGFKAIAARIAQPFFRRAGGGSKIPIRVTGTRTNPTFGVDVKRALLPG
jgi:hypothetical protein